MSAKEGAILHPMKTSLKFTVLFLAASYPCMAFAEMLGAKVPAVLNVENVATLFSLLLIGLTLISDYSRRSRPLASRVTVACTQSYRETHRLAA
jgi:hypothetical protein